MPENIRPVAPRIPCDAIRGIDLDGHHLAYIAALDENDCCPESSRPTTPLLSPLNISSNKRIVIGDVGARNNVSSLYRESMKGGEEITNEIQVFDREEETKTKRKEGKKLTDGLDLMKSGMTAR